MYRSALSGGTVDKSAAFFAFKGVLILSLFLCVFLAASLYIE